MQISERVKARLEKSRQQGRIGGRPTLDETTITKIQLFKSSGMNITAISKELKISRGSVYQHLAKKVNQNKITNHHPIAPGNCLWYTGPTCTFISTVAPH